MFEFVEKLYAGMTDKADQVVDSFDGITVLMISRENMLHKVARCFGKGHFGSGCFGKGHFCSGCFGKGHFGSGCFGKGHFGSGCFVNRQFGNRTVW